MVDWKEVLWSTFGVEFSPFVHPKIVGLSMLTKKKPAFTSLWEIRHLARSIASWPLFLETTKCSMILSHEEVTSNHLLSQVTLSFHWSPHLWVALVTHRTPLEPLDITGVPRQLKSSAKDAGAHSRITHHRHRCCPFIPSQTFLEVGMGVASPFPQLSKCGTLIAYLLSGNSDFRGTPHYLLMGCTFLISGCILG